MIGVGRIACRLGLIVEGNVAAHHRQLERAAGLGDALDRLGELPQDLGSLRRAEVQAVGEPERLAPPAHGDVAGGLARPPSRRRGRGSRKTWRPLPSVETASPRRVPLTRRTAASEPGRTSVLMPTCWSYWRYAQSLDAMVGEPEQR